MQIVPSLLLDLPISNGLADVSALLSEALSKPPAANGVRIVRIGPGIYRAKNCIIHSNTILIATGASFIQDEQSADGDTLFRLLPGTSNVSLYDFEIDGKRSKLKGLTNVSGIEVGEDCSDLLFANLTVRDTIRSSIIFSGGARRVEVDSPKIINSGRFGIVFDFHRTKAHAYLNVHDGYFEDCAEGPISGIANDGTTASAGINHVTWHDNHAKDCGQGISAYSPNNFAVSIANNIIEHSGRIEPRPHGHASHLGGNDVHMRGNTALNTTIGAFLFSAFPNETPPNCTGFSCTDNTVRTTITSGNGAGIEALNYSEGVISGNRIFASTENAIHVEGKVRGGSRVSGVVISGNVVRKTIDADDHQNSEVGVLLKNADDCVVSANKVYDTHDSCMVLDSVAGTSVTGNRLKGSATADGLLIQDSSKVAPSLEIDVSGNTITDNAGAGVRTTDDTDYVLIGLNLVRRNAVDYRLDGTHILQVKIASRP